MNDETQPIPAEDDPNPPPVPAEDDLAPDANEPGDTTLPEELQGLEHEGEIVPDNVDKEEVENDG